MIIEDLDHEIENLELDSREADDIEIPDELDKFLK